MMFYDVLWCSMMFYVLRAFLVSFCRSVPPEFLRSFFQQFSYTPSPSSNPELLSVSELQGPLSSKVSLSITYFDIVQEIKMLLKPIPLQSKCVANKTLLVFGLRQRREISFIRWLSCRAHIRSSHCRCIFTTKCHQSMSSPSIFTIKHLCSSIHLQITSAPIQTYFLFSEDTIIIL